MAIIDINLAQLNEGELIELNHRIIQRLRFFRDTRSHHHVLRYNVGDVVCFTAEGGKTVTGTVVRLNRKSVSVVTKEGMHWRVSPSYLSLVKTHHDHYEDTASESCPNSSKPPNSISRNAPCPCGSGKKYKRCCLSHGQFHLFR